MNPKFEKLGFYPAGVLLPKDADMTKWAVVAGGGGHRGGRPLHAAPYPAGGTAERP